MISIKNIFEGLLSENEYFDDSTKIPDYDSLLNKDYDRIPSDWKNYSAKLEYMSPEEYIRRVSDIQDVPYEEQSRYIDSNKVKEYAKEMSNGAKFPIPYLNYADKNQEGRHRAMASKMLTDKDIPVVIVTKDQVNKDGGYSETFDLSDIPEYIGFLNIIGGELDGALDLLLKPKTYTLNDMEFEAKQNNSKYLDDVEWDQAPEQLKQLVKNELKTLSPQQIKDAEEDGINFNSVEGMFDLVEYYADELPELFFYLKRLISGVKEYMVDNINKDLIDDNPHITFNDGVVMVNGDSKEEVQNYDFGFTTSDDIEELNRSVIDAWMNKYPYK